MLVEDDSERNRRESFRIDDTLTLAIRPLDDESLELITSDFNAFRLRYCMKSHIQNQNELRKPKLIRIRKSDPDIAAYLEYLENQITQMAERLDQCSNSSDDTVEVTVRANLSATGIRFRTELALAEDQFIEIGMMLSSQDTQVVVVGKLIRVDNQSDQQNHVSVSYAHIHPEDTEAIIRHMARLQQVRLQARRGVG